MEKCSTRILAASLCFAFVILISYTKVSENLQQSQRMLTNFTLGNKGTETLTRQGNDIRHFDAKKCPPGSIIWNASYMAPIHSDCPTLFIVGTPKGGTTSMLEFVSMHSDFEGAELRTGKFGGKGELNFFRRRGMTWDQYKKHFPTGVITGESSTWYMSECEVPKRIFQFCGKKAKVVMLLRNPVHRIISHYVMEKMWGQHKSFSIEDYVSLHLNKYIATATQPQFHIRNVTNEWDKQRCMPRNTNLINFGLYYPQIMNWLCNFPAENIMIIQSEEFYQYPSRVVTQVLHFIGLSSLSEEDYAAISSTVYNKGNYDKYGVRMSDKQLKQLHNLYRPFNAALFELLYWNSVDWS